MPLFGSTEAVWIWSTEAIRKEHTQSLNGFSEKGKPQSIYITEEKEWVIDFCSAFVSFISHSLTETSSHSSIPAASQLNFRQRRNSTSTCALDAEQWRGDVNRLKIILFSLMGWGWWCKLSKGSISSPADSRRYCAVKAIDRLNRKTDSVIMKSIVCLCATEDSSPHRSYQVVIGDERSIWMHQVYSHWQLLQYMWATEILSLI